MWQYIYITVITVRTGVGNIQPMFWAQPTSSFDLAHGWTTNNSLDLT